jgi:3-deoxy-D-manno-octulosonate 8-phosphate phosphatase (KDO 8-P phosphatase)
MPEIQNDLFAKIKFLAFDFDGVFTDNIVYTTEDGKESVACWRSDGLGLAKIKQLGIPIWVISTETNPVVSKRCKKLGINCIQGCNDKLEALSDLLAKNGILFNETAYVGNDINDTDCLKSVGVPIVVADAHSDVMSLAKYITIRPGGRGAVREICDLITKNSNN